MKIQEAEFGAVTVLTLRGELSNEQVDVFRQRASELIAQQRCQLLLDCSAVSALDSTGLESLTELQRLCRQGLGNLKLCGLDAVARKIFEITRLALRFELFDDVETGLRSFS